MGEGICGGERWGAGGTGVCEVGVGEEVREMSGVEWAMVILELLSQRDEDSAEQKKCFNATHNYCYTTVSQ